MIVWPKAMRRLREQGAHYGRRLKRMEMLALDGRRVDYENEKFPIARSYVQGQADAFEEALQIVGESAIDEEMEIDREVVALAQSGLGVEQIAGRCGLSIEDVAAALAKFAKIAAQDEEAANA